MTYVTNVLTEYLDESANIRTDSSRETYRRTLLALDDFLGHAPLRKVTIDHLVAFCHHSQTEGKTIAPSTTLSRRHRCESFFEWCETKEYVPTSPARSIRRRVAPKARTVRKNNWLDKEQVAHIFNVMPTATLRDRRTRAVLALGFYAGLRAMEIRAIRWGHIDFEARTIWVANGKGQKQALLGMGERARTELSTWAQEFECRPDHYVIPQLYCSNLGTGLNDYAAEMTVPLPEQGLNSYGPIRESIRDAQAVSGIEFRPHDMRRSFAGMLHDADVPLENLMHFMRHDNIATTQRYLETRPEIVANAMTRVEVL